MKKRNRKAGGASKRQTPSHLPSASDYGASMYQDHRDRGMTEADRVRSLIAEDRAQSGLDSAMGVVKSDPSTWALSDHGRNARRRHVSWFRVMVEKGWLPPSGPTALGRIAKAISLLQSDVAMRTQNLDRVDFGGHASSDWAPFGTRCVKVYREWEKACAQNGVSAVPAKALAVHECSAAELAKILGIISQNEPRGARLSKGRKMAMELVCLSLEIFEDVWTGRRT